MSLSLDELLEIRKLIVYNSDARLHKSYHSVIELINREIKLKEFEKNYPKEAELVIDNPRD